MNFYRYISALLLLFGTTYVLMASAAFAQVNVNLRSGDHNEYSRLVFDWPEAANYTALKSGSLLSLSFGKSALLDLSAVNQENLKNIGTVNVTSKAGDKLAVSIQIKSESKFRHFKIGNRVVIDVYNAAGSIKKSATIKVPSSPEKTSKISAPPQRGLKTAIYDKPVESGGGIKKLSGMEPHVITLTSTQAVGLSAFERSGFFWLVFDRPNLKTVPVIAGPQKEAFPKLEKIKVPSATVYRMVKPEGYNFYGEGGGLLWRVVMTPNPRRTAPTLPIVEKLNPQEIRGGTLNWPFLSTRKIITLTDPLIGDEITVVTTEGAESFSGPARQYVDLNTLPSVVGLAFIAKTDGIVTTKAPKGVNITSPQGLALSAKEDTALAVLKDDIEKEEDFFDDEEKTERLSRIYDFDRWEMGGLKALEGNSQILMRGMSSKKGAARVEDILTLAKLNLASNRGPEALGLLTLAAQELPGIDENPEFLALRGAAKALSGKLDSGFEDLSDPSLKQYTEIKYWRAAILAGLEDWQQADSVMPSDFDVLATYPFSIQKPLVLALSEVSLRAGKIAQAEELLGLLEAEFPTMTLAQQSSWKYLNGELEHQKDNPKAAIENWKTLVKGKDDYYRAKAGLSLTKLQLERQKITPAKAIDRLEGLRYAWRGDELETLINYRLGQVYIEDKEYLKGLSVLRSAISLLPNSQISREVTDYMTNTFRRIFTDGTLQDISPLDAISIYDEFKELTPMGEEGDVFVQNLAERLVEIDLLGRASDLLEHQLDHRLKGGAAVRVAIRLAAIQLIDGKSDKAINSLAKARNALGGVAGGDKVSLGREITLLKARALSKLNRASEGLDLLKKLPNAEDVNRLRADIAWNAGRWGQAAQAFSNLIAGEKISLTRPANDYQTNLIINRAIALNLSGDRTALSELRKSYQDLMTQTPKAKIFDLVTRPRQLGMLENKDSVTSLISEVDLFGEFLENYKTSK
jgi:predicted negative regulator of RcsB-dependent stress response